MKTESHSINDVLAKNATSFFIPPFQRSYAWGKPEIERYFNDILRIVDSQLDTKQHDKLEHFFGTLVIKEEKAGFANKSIVVDGQQRLTTTLIFLIALRDSEPDIEKRNFINQNYLLNNSSTFEDKIKLKQVTKDWESYRALVNKREPKPGIIKSAYIIFTKLINDTKRRKPEITLEDYIIAIQRINVAVIFLDERPFKGEDPQIIFETLNSLGKPLTLSDLVRNFVLLNMNSESQSDIYEKIWHPKIELVLNEETSKFFRDYLQYKTRSSVKVVSNNNTKEIYQLFKEFVNSEFDCHKEFIKDIVRYTNWYKYIITGVVSKPLTHNNAKNNEIEELIKNIFHDIKAEAFKPFVLGLLEYHQCGVEGLKLYDDKLISILKTIRTYLIRRRVIGLTQGENKSIVLLSNRIGDLANGNVTMLELLSSMFFKLRLPNDSEMSKALETMSFYQSSKKYSKFILGKIEEHNTKVAVDYRNPKITIEHIMPQKINKEWIDELGDNYESVHKNYLHNIGNLILTEFNTEIGNKSFSYKKQKLNSSSLNYRLYIINKETWNETSIKEHQRNMIAWFLETFPLPELYRDEENWNVKTAETEVFSPLDEDAGHMAEGNKPKAIYIENNKIDVRSWQNVFIVFLKYIKDKEEYDFELILDHQSELFGNEETIVKWRELESLLDSNIDLTNRYKTFNGKFWNRVDSLDDDMYFIHINISSYTCMNRIANIMNKFNMSEEDVQIVLK